MAGEKPAGGSEACGFADLAYRIVVREQTAQARKGAQRTLTTEVLAGHLDLPLSTTSALLGSATRSRFSPAQARAIMALTGDVRLPQWLLEGTPFVPALRPERIAVHPQVAANLPVRDDARLHASATTLMQEACNLLLAVIAAASDMRIDEADRATLRAEIADIDHALATLRTVVDAPQSGRARS